MALANPTDRKHFDLRRPDGTVSKHYQIWIAGPLTESTEIDAQLEDGIVVRAKVIKVDRPRQMMTGDANVDVVPIVFAEELP